VAVFHTLEDLRELEPPPMAADTPERRALAREAIGAGLPGLAAQPSSVGRARFVRALCGGMYVEMRTLASAARTDA
jgi:hypothetical protein